ncbi:syndecan-1 isoform X1 [Vombatus ursinus]|uniref:Syndecan n=1 Tax=Vombatus ursinus TaxID=29139 RepID=A0A4X2MBF1_VOMUR|nr:syndecan-1 isoform X1 [Vombatus ursinus]
MHFSDDFHPQEPGLPLRHPSLPPCSQIMGTNIPPEDLDGSGDDDDAFSGSGAGALLETPLLDKSLLSRKTPVLPTALTAAPPEPTHTSPGKASPGGREASGEGSALPPGRGPEAEPAPNHEPTHSPPAVTLPSTTHRPSTVGATMASDPSVVHPRVSTPEPPSSGEEGPLASGTPGSDQPDGGSTQHLGEESSGSGSDDFTFAPSGEKPASPLDRNKPDQEVVDSGATGASQGILDRKEVLGGVIAGGLVGLLFAVFLVGFMLYRMKKKDEGSYSLEEPKQANGGYQKPQRQEEFYA